MKSSAAMSSDRPRVLLVVESSGAGTGRHVLDLAEGLLSRGCDVHLLYSTGRMDAMFRDRLAQIPHLHRAAIPMRTNIHPSDLAAVWRVRRYLRKHGPFDAIHGHSSKGGACARLAALGTKTPVFYTMHGLVTMDTSLSWAKRGLYHAIEFGLSLRTRAVIAVSPEERRQAVRAGLGRSRVRLAPNGVGPFNGAPRDEARKTIGCDETAVVFGFVGRLVPQKAPDVLLDVFARVAAAVPNARLAIVGDGPLMTLLRELARRSGVAEKVMLLGERDARSVIAGFDVFTMASRKEGLPYVVLEALAAGLPVVATRGSGVEILVDPGVNGAVVPDDDVAALAAAMTELALDAARRARCGQASLAMARRFSLDAMVDRVLRLYTEKERTDATMDFDFTAQAEAIT